MFPLRLKTIRETRGFSQQDLAERTNISLRQVQRYESNESDPNSEALQKLARELEVSIDYLLGLVDKPRDHIEDKQLSGLEFQIVAALRAGDIRRIMYLLSTDEGFADSLNNHVPQSDK